jgi:hypothetical protein
MSSSERPVYKKIASQSLHNKKKFKKKSGDANYETNFPFYFLLHKRAKPIHPPYIHPSAHLSTHSSTHHSTHPKDFVSIKPLVLPSATNPSTLLSARVTYEH